MGAGEQPVDVGDDRDRASESPEGLSHLGADAAASDDRQVRGQFGETPDGLVREVSHSPECGRDVRSGACGEHDSLRPDPFVGVES